MASLYGIDNKNARPNLVKNAQPRRFFRLGVQVCLYDYANQGSAAFIDDACKRLLQLCLCIDGHLPELCDNAFARNIIQRFAEDVRLPNPARVALKALQEKVDDLLRGFFPAERRADLAMIIWMDGADALSRTP